MAVAPVILRGSADLSTYPGVVTGVLASSAARTANGTALQAGLDWCASNGKFAELPPARYEYVASGTQSGRNVGLRLPPNVSLIGGGASPMNGTLLVQFATNHPVLTLGSLVAGDYTEAATIRGLVVGHGVTQAGRTTAEGLLIGEYWRSRFDDLLISPFFVGVYHPTYGVRIGVGPANHFFSNDVGSVAVYGGQVNLWRQDAGGTGSRFANVYLGGGTFGNRVATTSHPCYFNASGSDIGSFGQLNVEWTAPADFCAPLGFNGCDGVDIAHLHLEGNRAGGFDAQILANISSSKVNIGTVKILDAWVATANVSGTPRVLAPFGDCQIDIGQFYARWNGAGYNAEAVANADFRLIHPSDVTTAGVRRDIEVRNLDILGNTGAFHFDANLTGAAPGSAGAVYSAKRYVYDKTRSRTENAVIEARDASLTVYAAHRNPQIRLKQALTADRKVILSDLMSASGIGNVAIRQPGDTASMFREAGATGAFRWLLRNTADSTTIITLSAANTEGSAILANNRTWDAS